MLTITMFKDTRKNKDGGKGGGSGGGGDNDNWSPDDTPIEDGGTKKGK